MILDETLLRKLDQVSFVTQHIHVGRTAGERRSTKHGSSVEFADYRDYVRGDDPRRVDWNVYARLERPYVKLFEEKEDLAVHVLLDGSRSMAWGEAEAEKWHYARQLAAGLSYVALGSGDRLTVATLHTPRTLSATFGPVRGRGHALRLFDWLAQAQAAGATDLNARLRHYALAGGRPGLVLLISDLFSPAGYLEGLTALAARGHEVVILHTLTPDEVDPPLGGDLRLRDVETGDTQEVTIDVRMRRRYRRRLDEWRETIVADCRSRNAHYVPIETDVPVERVLLYDLRRSGVVR